MSTDYTRVAPGQKAYLLQEQEKMYDTVEKRRISYEAIKVVQVGGEITFSGCKKINYTDQRIKAACLKINKMLGGN